MIKKKTPKRWQTLFSINMNAASTCYHPPEAFPFPSETGFSAFGHLWHLVSITLCESECEFERLKQCFFFSGAVYLQYFKRDMGQFSAVKSSLYWETKNCDVRFSERDLWWTNSVSRKMFTISGCSLYQVLTVLGVDCISFVCKHDKTYLLLMLQWVTLALLSMQRVRVILMAPTSWCTSGWNWWRRSAQPYAEGCWWPPVYGQGPWWTQALKNVEIKNEQVHMFTGQEEAKDSIFQ